MREENDNPEATTGEQANAESVIKVSNVSKSYAIRHQDTAGYNTFKDDFVNYLKKPIGGGMREKRETFWALRDVSFEVKKGEIFGVIGKNGSGKSTLLKILSRIVDPTEGQIEMRGRVASLLEVGTGFHPELTGRENIYFNGSMLGMNRSEIARKFDQIVEFAEIEKFLDTPVKFYSSGMYVRLAFSVAAHLEPDILILDEVLSVGDAGFQKKSMNRILSFMQEGRTVLIVSHSIAVLKTVCDRGMLLVNGKVKTIGDIEHVASVYNGTLPAVQQLEPKKLEGVEVEDIEVHNENDLTTDKPFEAEVTFTTTNRLPNCYINFCVEDETGVMAIHCRTDHAGKNPDFDSGKHTVKIKLPRLSLIPGKYSTWFRIYSEDGKKVHLLDSPRVEFKVKGSVIYSLTAVSVPVEWHWDKHS